MAAETHGADHAAQASAGLPQFDFSFFPSQIFWLTVFFTLLYLLLDRALLPKIGGVIEKREGKIKGDVDAAAKANADAQNALAAYDSAMARAKAEARSRMDAARGEAAQARTTALAEAESKLVQRLTAAEERLSTQRSAGFDAARAAAEDVAKDIVAKLTGAKAA